MNERITDSSYINKYK